MRRERIATAERRRGEIFEVRSIETHVALKMRIMWIQGLPQEESVQNKPGLGLTRQFGRLVTWWY